MVCDKIILLIKAVCVVRSAVVDTKGKSVRAVARGVVFLGREIYKRR